MCNLEQAMLSTNIVIDYINVTLLSTPIYAKYSFKRIRSKRNLYKIYLFITFKSIFISVKSMFSNCLAWIFQVREPSCFITDTISQWELNKTKFKIINYLMLIVHNIPYIIIFVGFRFLRILVENQNIFWVCIEISLNYIWRF